MASGPLSPPGPGERLKRPGLIGLIGLLHLGRCLGAGIVVGLSEGGIVVVGGNVVVKALGGKVDVVVCMCGNVAVDGIVGISVKVAVDGIVGVSGKVAVGCVVIIRGEVVVGGIVGISDLWSLLKTCGAFCKRQLLPSKYFTPISIGSASRDSIPATVKNWSSLLYLSKVWSRDRPKKKLVSASSLTELVEKGKLMFC